MVPVNIQKRCSFKKLYDMKIYQVAVLSIFWITIITNLKNILSLEDTQTLLLGNLQLTLSTKLLLDIYAPRANVLHGYIGWLPRHSNLTYEICSPQNSYSDNICLQYSNGMRLNVWMEDDIERCHPEAMSCKSISCYEIAWRNHIAGVMDCFILGDDLWYGGGEKRFQHWPLQNDSRKWHPIATGDFLHHPTGGIVENIWLSTNGFLLKIKNNVPLFMSFNVSGNEKICFSSSRKKHPFYNENIKHSELAYTLCAAHSVKKAYTYGKEHMEKPHTIPDELMFKYPVWSTWARYKQYINETTVIQFAKEINKNKYPKSHIEIDDNWETCYGDLMFHKIKFPNPKQMIENLQALGFRVTLWIHPFCNVDCSTFLWGEKKGYWVKDSKNKTMLVNWWNGIGSMLDVTNSEAVQWFIYRLENLKVQYGINSFKFDAGEVMWLQEQFRFYNGDAQLEPNLYSKLYAEMASYFGNMVEVRVGYNTQNLPIFVRMFDKFSNWDYDNGLKTLIPTALHFSLMGYSFMIPDMVGGNNYNTINNSLPSQELYIRWLQVNVFLPVIQFSITPWDYNKNVTKIALKMVKLHKNYSTYFIRLAEQSTVDGNPIIRPLWWIAPDDTVTYNIDSEFLVGDEILVAPVLEKGAEERDIYLPEGQWKDMLRNDIYEGPQWLRKYSAKLDELPYFLRQELHDKYESI